MCCFLVRKKKAEGLHSVIIQHLFSCSLIYNEGEVCQSQQDYRLLQLWQGVQCLLSRKRLWLVRRWWEDTAVGGGRRAIGSLAIYGRMSGHYRAHTYITCRFHLNLSEFIKTHTQIGIYSITKGKTFF